MNKSSTRFYWMIGGVIVFLASILRLYALDHKTMMHDELLFAYYSHDQLYQEWTYLFQPILHGPLMLHLQNLIFHIFGVNDSTVRLGVALLGIGTIVLILTWRPFLGGRSTLLASALVSISPGILYFNRFLHMDALYLFVMVGLITTAAHWIRSGASWLLALHLIGWWLLFSTKSSAVFLLFTFLTFLLLLVVYTIAVHGLPRFDWREKETQVFIAGNIVIGTGAFGLLLLIWINVFEGIRFDADVIQAIGHDSPLKEVSVLRTLFLIQPNASIITSVAIIIVFLTVIIAIAILVSLLRLLAQNDEDQDSIFPILKRHLHGQGPIIISSLGIGFFLYMAIYTTGFVYPKSPFGIYRETFSYWSGQHAWGRIPGPFHLHLLNMAIYELPALLLVAGTALCIPRRINESSHFYIVFLILSGVLVGMHLIVFRPLYGVTQAPLIFLGIAVLAIIFSFICRLFPNSGRTLFSAFLAVGFLLMANFFSGSSWEALRQTTVIHSSGLVQFTFAESMERRLNMDGGWNLMLVFFLIAFSLGWIWSLLSEGRFFTAFIIWLFLTMFGAASYAREGVPQVGIHAILPLLVLAAIAAVGLYDRLSGRPAIRGGVLLIGSLALVWTFRVSIQLNFIYPNDPRERFVYASTSDDIRAHMELIQRSRALASVRMNPIGMKQLLLTPNDRRMEKDVRVGSLPLSHVAWPARWYLRDVQFIERDNFEGLMEQDLPFLFLAVAPLNEYPGLEERYIVYRGRSTQFWVPEPIGIGELTPAIQRLFPPVLRRQESREVQLAAEKVRWIWRYYTRRELPTRPGEITPGLSSADYLFAIRRDLPNY